MGIRIFDTEYRFMCIVWEKEPVASLELVKLCSEKFGWKKSTTYSVIKRLSERGAMILTIAVMAIFAFSLSACAKSNGIMQNAPPQTCVLDFYKPYEIGYKDAALYDAGISQDIIDGFAGSPSEKEEDSVLARGADPMFADCLPCELVLSKWSRFNCFRLSACFLNLSEHNRPVQCTFGLLR